MRRIRIFAQWKQFGNTNSPFLSLRYINGFLQSKFCHSSNQVKTNLAPLSSNIWYDISVNYQLNQNQTGHFSIWLDGQKIQTYKGPLGFSPNGNAIHFHLGIYRDQLTIPQTLYFDQFCRSVKKPLIVLPNHSPHSNQDTSTYN